MKKEDIDPELFSEAAHRVLEAKHNNEGVLYSSVSISGTKPVVTLHSAYDFEMAAHDVLEDSGVHPGDPRYTPLKTKVAREAGKLVENGAEIVARRQEKADILNDSPARRAILKARSEDIDPEK